MSRILFTSSEATPLVKTGGLGDISGSLPAALKAMRHSVRLILPAYPQALERIGKTRLRVHFSLDGETVSLLEGRMPDSGVTVWLVDSPKHFSRSGGPYVDNSGNDWPDNAERFALFCRVIVEIAMGRIDLKWRPEVVHCNDWQTALIPALLSLEKGRPGSVFSIHNLSYQGLFPYSTFRALGLPDRFWHYSALEFHGEMSMIKGGLVYADRLTTVSPSYANEICTPWHGGGLDGLLRYRRNRLSGILNGVDYNVWNPAEDPLIEAAYTVDNLTGKRENKRALQKKLNLPIEADLPLLGLVSRFVAQKGIDLLVKAAPQLLAEDVQLVMLGNGDGDLERAAKALARKHPRQVAVEIGYDEALAHQIEAGADLFLMPSRFEPCGLNQLYSLRYGTLPVVHRTGGLADTVVHTDRQSLKDGSATGFVFEHATPEGLVWAFQQALACYHRPACLEQVMRNGMRQDFSWRKSAREYLTVYRQAIQDAASS